MSERPFAITLEVGSSRANHTGSWRSERPEYVRRMPPCNAACPAGEDIQGWLYEAEAGGGGYHSAWRALVAVNPLPAVMGHVCFHPCEEACNRLALDEAVGINAVERFLGEEAIRRGWEPPSPAQPSGRRVLVVGSGPAGLSAAWQLALRGHHVTLRERSKQPGGMMRYGIPAYRLPRRTLDAEIERITALGVQIECGQRVGSLAYALQEGAFDAAFLALGADVAHHIDIPGATAARVIDAVAFLHATAEGQAPVLGRRVVVYGGGDTALDAARTAARLGHGAGSLPAPQPLAGAPGAQEDPGGEAPPAPQEPVVVYRRTAERMPAHPQELAEAREEGISFRWLSTIAAARGERLVLERMRLDEQGMPQPTGELEELPADCVILALGEEPDLTPLQGLDGVIGEDGRVAVNEAMMTARPGLFAGGDLIAQERNVAVAVGHGRRAARSIDAYLRGFAMPGEEAPEPVAFADLNPWYFTDAPRQVAPKLARIRRQSTFEEVVLTLAEDSALYEARRCFSCGSCFSCDNCYGVCPDDAVLKPGPDGSPYAIDLDYCKGCGMCAAECPCGAIAMVPEQT
ncbi:MAG TPA: NAD(P)-binding protein [Solirubrobacteraceae bacterium]|nr:NAD(P)-binding protein [Solirubrobacteraceae bacterium]